MTGLLLQWWGAFKIYVRYLIWQFYDYYGNTNSYNMSYKVNRVAKFELENFKCVVEIFGLSIDFRSMLLSNSNKPDQPFNVVYQYTSSL